LFSFAGDTVLDPFVGTGSTGLAAIRSGRNSLGVDVEEKYLSIAATKLAAECAKGREVGAVEAYLDTDGISTARGVQEALRG
jgi:site-specific DNA-methyltransferase (adenine-specific)